MLAQHTEEMGDAFPAEYEEDLAELDGTMREDDYDSEEAGKQEAGGDEPNEDAEA